MKYETLLDEAYAQGLIVKEKHLRYNDGRIKGNKVAIRKSIETNRKKACVLAEELGHYYTSAGNILDQSNAGNLKQERAARGWAYNKLVPLEDIRQAHQRGYAETYEMADYLDVDEAFLIESLTYYQQKGFDLSAENEKNVLYSLMELLLNEKHD